VFFIHPDHLDTPRAIVNASNQAVWKWDSAPFGETSAIERPTQSIATNFAFNLRFPGQQFDSETALHYNYFRDYEPGVGRYVQSDPIGLHAEQFDTFSYVGLDPLGGIDPNGLARGGVYTLRNPGTGEVRYVGRSKDLKKRRSSYKNAKRYPIKCELDFRPELETDSYPAQRGGEQLLKDKLGGDLNKDNPISPKNKNRTKYIKAGCNCIRTQRPDLADKLGSGKKNK
jgi:RHS repeat-associated protein